MASPPLPSPEAPVGTPALKVGLFGGRFDPPHRGHLLMAKAAADQLGLQTVLWIVSGNPIHKTVSTPAHHRLEMVRRLLDAQSDARQQACDLEVRLAAEGLETPTHLTLDQLALEMPLSEAIWLMGKDQLAGFRSWRRWQGVAQRISLGVFDRSLPGERDQTTETLAESLRDEVPSLRVHRIGTVQDPTNATEIRRQLRSGGSVGDSVAPVVLEYALSHRLYAD